MWNSRRINTFTIAMLAWVLVWPISAAAKGPPPKVQQAIPDNALQGDQNVFMILKGENFGPNAKIRFLISGTNSEGHIYVDESTIQFNSDSGDLEFFITVDPLADPVFYDIEVEILTANGGRRGKGTDLFKVNQKDGGGPYETDEFDIEYSGDLAGTGTAWTGGGSGQKNPPIGFWDPDAMGQGSLDLSYFVNGVFSGQRGANCFGTVFPIYTLGGSVEKRKRTGRAYSHMTFWGYTDDGSNIIVKYIIHLWGQLVDPVDWLPHTHNYMLIDTWKIALMDPYNGTYDNVACTGGSTNQEEFQTTIDIYRIN